MSKRQYAYLALAVLFVIFVLQNMQLDYVSFLFWDFSMPRLLLILSTLLIGIVIGALVPFRKLLPGKNK
ncbi:lipopolysaccharide assembly protein LapA domain-containing protein [Paraglaciecola sp. L1A13]|uniref:lipopolysaccharide assembly protein LapA domain-containing protein n=1 Tax=Paraglaciecola sp. L1A13 TaxID=2686359 RepID=UPI00131DE18A|nr:lipopolysaccharide assembly protein LapA domain-containing protein [Paraglaciecola sp. L1A13]|tara:strand:- start:13 stop:219 length:207 start_codon:yes stop_codon:yes gene_type:complete